MYLDAIVTEVELWLMVCSCFRGGSAEGVPGAPGAAELAAALRRLTPQEINSRRASLAASHVLRHRRHIGIFVYGIIYDLRFELYEQFEAGFALLCHSYIYMISSTPSDFPGNIY